MYVNRHFGVLGKKRSPYRSRIHKSSRQPATEWCGGWLKTCGLLLVVGEGGTQQSLTEDVVDDVRLAVHELVDHNAEDAHLRSTAVVELNCALLKLGLFRERLPLLLEGVDARHVARERALLLLHDEELEEADEDDDLGDAKAAHLRPCKKKRRRTQRCIIALENSFIKGTRPLDIKYNRTIGCASQ